MNAQLKSLFMLDPKITYLNHGSFGACPRPIFEELINWQKQLEYEPVKHLAYDIYDHLEESRDALSKYVNCNKDDIIFTPNPSTALNTVIKSLDLKKDDEILTTNHEYGALDKTWNFICKKTGAKYIKTKISLPLLSNKKFIKKIESNISKKTKIIFISHVTSSTALIFPVKQISELAKKHNIFCIIDGAHAPAYLDLDIDKIDCDVYVGACHKWMCSPKGVSFLYVKKEYQNIIDPLVVSWGYESEFPGKSKFLDYHQWQGTRDMSAYLTIPTTIDFLKKYNWNKITSECREINLWARDEINQMLNKKALCKTKFLGQMSSIYIKKEATIDYHIYFYKKYKIQIPFILWNNISFIRISIQAYNTKEDIYKLLDALKKEML
tara:strand:+ start:1323 stop:2465 length:1143 start_codon:yes stop_codon:yes gene_type:complete